MTTIDDLNSLANKRMIEPFYL